MTIEDFREAMSQRTDSDLLKILTIERDQFQSEAIIAAEEELRRRNLTVDQVESAKSEIKMKSQKDEEKANEPLELFWKILTFTIPGLINLIFSGAYLADGYQRKSRELRQWTFYGLGFYLGLILIIFIIGSFS